MGSSLGQLALTWTTTGKLESRLAARLGRPNSEFTPAGDLDWGSLNSELLCQNHALLVCLPTWSH